ncbi:hypothetical protein TBLA_0C02150 [Henningerozyma blattae CBS 6284]|uniref:MRH domain-containing protein n=1 Tax=Henningerozyma blattae (strain ATCC 34711 / CBS 6284 / DSM 70876 / NBRC 10599 / NRRL Y-10934 / UCD 77-7) TaxID=1071380 RepID=I2H0X5_HENB6|nr:hypothetical protein TBLA_0C02150 [Tetrapisispora blattae CBS 6284]CCH60027.1 hypothetical protein TBLA_0C02150 [Tetrapisispora blattae CBS 6284]
MSQEPAPSCAVMNTITGNFIDLSPLSNHPSKGQINRFVAKNWDSSPCNFTIAICSSPNSNIENEQLSNLTGAFYYDEQINKYVSIGKFNETPQLIGPKESAKKLILKYNNGDICPNGKDQKSSIFNFVCDKELTNKMAKVNFLGSFNDCGYFFEVRSIYACPTSNSSNEVNVLGIFVGIFFVFFLVELIRRRFLNTSHDSLIDRSSTRGPIFLPDEQDIGEIQRLSLTNTLNNNSLQDDLEENVRWEFIETEPKWRTLVKKVANATAKSLQLLTHRNTSTNSTISRPIYPSLNRPATSASNRITPSQDQDRSNIPGPYQDQIPPLGTSTTLNTIATDSTDTAFLRAMAQQNSMLDDLSEQHVQLQQDNAYESEH